MLFITHCATYGSTCGARNCTVMVPEIVPHVAPCMHSACYCTRRPITAYTYYTADKNTPKEDNENIRTLGRTQSHTHAHRLAPSWVCYLQDIYVQGLQVITNTGGRISRDTFTFEISGQHAKTKEK